LTTNVSNGSSVLLTGGRAPVTLVLARCFQQAGWRVFSAESIPQHLCSRSPAVAQNYLVASPRWMVDRYIQDLLAIIQAQQIDLLLPTCEEIYYIAQHRHTLAQHCQVFCADIAQLDLLHNKYRFIEHIASLSLPIPRTVMVTDPESLILACRLEAEGDHDLVLKPVYSRFGTQAQILSSTAINDIQQAAAPDAESPSIGRSEMPDVTPQFPWVVQEFIAGQQYCTYSVAHAGVVVATAIYPVQFTAADGACVYYELVQLPEIDRWIDGVVASLAFTGQIAFDLIVDRQGVIYPIECNPRATSGLCLIQDRLVAALMNINQPETEPPLQPYMLLLAMLVYSLPRAMQQGQWVHYWQQLSRAKDLLWDPGDWSIGWRLAQMMLGFYRISRDRGISLTAASTFDIEWNGEL
jgi:predicted ATP-grasp superfamily ATP-dependent carboligase